MTRLDNQAYNWNLLLRCEWCHYVLPMMAWKWKLYGPQSNVFAKHWYGNLEGHQSHGQYLRWSLWPCSTALGVQMLTYLSATNACTNRGLFRGDSYGSQNQLLIWTFQPCSHIHRYVTMINWSGKIFTNFQILPAVQALKKACRTSAGVVHISISCESSNSWIGQKWSTDLLYSITLHREWQFSSRLLRMGSSTDIRARSSTPYLLSVLSIKFFHSATHIYSVLRNVHLHQRAPFALGTNIRHPDNPLHFHLHILYPSLIFRPLIKGKARAIKHTVLCDTWTIQCYPLLIRLGNLSSAAKSTEHTNCWEAHSTAGSLESELRSEIRWNT